MKGILAVIAVGVLAVGLIPVAYSSGIIQQLEKLPQNELDQMYDVDIHIQHPWTFVDKGANIQDGTTFNLQWHQAVYQMSKAGAGFNHTETNPVTGYVTIDNPNGSCETPNGDGTFDATYPGCIENVNYGRVLYKAMIEQMLTIMEFSETTSGWGYNTQTYEYLGNPDLIHEIANFMTGGEQIFFNSYGDVDPTDPMYAQFVANHEHNIDRFCNAWDANIPQYMKDDVVNHIVSQPSVHPAGVDTDLCQ